MTPGTLLDIQQAIWMAGAALRERLATGVLFNPLTRRARRDPYALYRKIRERDPVHRSYAVYGWVLFRYEDCLQVVRDPRYSADDANFEHFERERARAVRRGAADPDQERTPIMLRSDPPTHTRLRGLVSKAFTPRAVEKLRGRVEEITDELLGDLGRRGSFDLIRDFAVPLPVTIIAEMLGIPAADRETFKRWSDDLVGFLDPLASPGPQQLRRTAEEFFAYMGEQAAERRARPRDDLLSALVLAEEAGDRLTEQELHSTLALLLAAGNETTTNLIGNGMLALLRHPDQLERLREEPELAVPAVEELLRFDSPVQETARIPLADLDFRGHPFRAGQNVILVLGSANRDPDVFPDPDRLDIGRPDNRHLSFSQGPHYCLGAQLARLEGEIALRELALRFPDLRCEQDLDQVRWRKFTFLRGLEGLALRV